VVPGGGDLGAALEDLWPDLQPAARRGLAVMVAAVEAAALLRAGRTVRAMDVSARERLCDHLEHRAGTPQRSAFAGLKTMVLVLAADDPAMQRALGTESWPPQLIRS
jgi:hypothetical protein